MLFKKEEITMKKLTAILLILVLTLTLSAYADEEKTYTITYVIDSTIEGMDTPYRIEYPASIEANGTATLSVPENHSGSTIKVTLSGTNYLNESGWYLVGQSKNERLNLSITQGTTQIPSGYTWTLNEVNNSVTLTTSITSSTAYAAADTYTCPVTFNICLN